MLVIFTLLDLPVLIAALIIIIIIIITATRFRHLKVARHRVLMMTRNKDPLKKLCLKLFLVRHNFFFFSLHNFSFSANYGYSILYFIIDACLGVEFFFFFEIEFV